MPRWFEPLSGHPLESSVNPHYALLAMSRIRKLPALLAINPPVGCDSNLVGLAFSEAEPNTLEI